MTLFEKMWHPLDLAFWGKILMLEWWICLYYTIYYILGICDVCAFACWGNSAREYVFSMCGVCVLYIFNRKEKKLSWWGWWHRRCFSLKCQSMKYYLCMQGEMVPSLIFKILSLDCMRFSLCVIQSSHFVLWPLYFLVLTMTLHIMWGLFALPSFNVYIILDRDVTCLLFLSHFKGIMQK